MCRLLYYCLFHNKAEMTTVALSMYDFLLTPILRSLQLTDLRSQDSQDAEFQFQGHSGFSKPKHRDRPSNSVQ